MGISPTDLGVASWDLNRQAKTITISLLDGRTFTLARDATDLAQGETVIALRVKTDRKCEIDIRDKDGNVRVRWHHPEETRVIEE